MLSSVQKIASSHRERLALIYLRQSSPRQVRENFRSTENTERYRRRLVHQLERLGHQVTLQPLPEAA